MSLPPDNTILRFKAHLAVHSVRSDLLLIVSEGKRSALQHSLLARVAPFIDGVRSIAEIVTALAPELQAGEVIWCVEHLQQRGDLEFNLSRESGEPSQQAWWQLFGCQPVQNPIRVSVEALAGLDTAAMQLSLQQVGARVLPFAESQIHLLLLDDALRPEVLQISQTCQIQNKPLLLVKTNGMRPGFGPLLHAKLGSCPHCLQFWLRQQQPVNSWLNRQQPSPGNFLPLAQNAGAAQIMYAMLAQAINHLFASGIDHIPLRDNILCLDLKTFQTSKHRIVRRPQCPACGDPSLLTRRAWQPPQLRQKLATACEDGGYRQQDPAQTFAQYQHLINPVCGPVSYLHPMPGRHQGMRKVYVAGYLTCPEEAPYENHFDKTCAGKGHTDDQAKASALCETLERWSGVWQGDEARRRGSLAQLQAEGAIGHNFNDLQNFSERQFAARARINAEQSDPRRQIPALQTADTVIDWTPAWSITSGKMQFLPLTYCFAQAPGSSGRSYGIHNPNGCAAGVGLEEATLQGILELVERDACAIWWYNRLPRPALQLDQLNDGYARRLHQHYHDLGWQIWALDLSHDLQIPVYAALAFEPQQQRYAIGFGCHLDAGLALQRALTELNQLFDPSKESSTPWDQSLLPDASFLHPNAGYTDLPAKPSNTLGSDLLADIHYCVEQLQKAGMECILLDKTRPDIGLAVAQVVVPGLRHFWPRFGAGRLYDVPVTLGWLAQATKEEDLNPAPLFL